MIENNLLLLSDTFDHDFGQSNDLALNDHSSLHTNDYGISLPIDSNGLSSYDGMNDFLDYQDPLKYAYKHQFPPLVMDLGNTHFVNPHYVNGYSRNDGTYVEGYYRDGDGNPAIDQTVEQGGGYIRSNPDGNPFNNLK